LHPIEGETPINYYKSVLAGFAAFAISVFLLYLAIVFAGRATDFVMFSHFRWMLTILAPFLLMIVFFLRIHREQKTRSAAIKR
jgi:membrane protein DedA with SNARE-associated domain